MKIHCRSIVQQVFSMLNTVEGRSKFWAESTIQTGEKIHFIFPNRQEYNSAIIEINPPNLFSIDYFHSTVHFYLEESSNGGTDVTLINDNVTEDEYCDVSKGWVSVLLALKAAVDFNIDLRNHDVGRKWDEGFVDN